MGWARGSRELDPEELVAKRPSDPKPQLHFADSLASPLPKISQLISKERSKRRINPKPRTQNARNAAKLLKLLTLSLNLRWEATASSTTGTGSRGLIQPTAP